MISLPDNYEEIVAEALREMAANTARIIARAMAQQVQDPYPLNKTHSVTTGHSGKERAAPTTPTKNHY
jgi:hypothetical protein